MSTSMSTSMRTVSVQVWIWI